MGTPSWCSGSGTWLIKLGPVPWVSKRSLSPWSSHGATSLTSLLRPTQRHGSRFAPVGKLLLIEFSAGPYGSLESCRVDADPGGAHRGSRKNRYRGLRPTT